MAKASSVFPRSYSKQNVYKQWKKAEFNPLLCLAAPILENSESSKSKSLSSPKNLVCATKPKRGIIRKGVKGLQTKLTHDSLKSVPHTEESMSMDDLGDSTVASRSDGASSATSITDSESLTITPTHDETTEDYWSDIELPRDVPIPQSMPSKSETIGSIPPRQNKSVTTQVVASSSKRSAFSLSDDDSDETKAGALPGKGVVPTRLRRRLGTVVQSPKRHSIKRKDTSQNENRRKVSFSSAHQPHKFSQPSLAVSSTSILKKRRDQDVLQPLTSTPNSKSRKRKKKFNFMELSFETAAVPLPTFDDEDLISMSSVQKNSTITGSKSKVIPNTSLDDHMFDIQEVSFEPMHSTPNRPEHTSSLKYGAHLPKSLSELATPVTQLKGPSTPLKPSKSKAGNLVSQMKKKQLQYSNDDSAMKPSPIQSTSFNVNSAVKDFPRCGQLVDMEALKKYPQDVLETLPDSVFV